MSQKTQRVLFWVAMLTPPWNLFWWAVGMVWGAWMRLRHGRAFGGYCLYLVIFAPYMLPEHLIEYRYYQKLAKQREEREK